MPEMRKFKKHSSVVIWNGKQKERGKVLRTMFQKDEKIA